jgi:hypothetical protein
MAGEALYRNRALVGMPNAVAGTSLKLEPGLQPLNCQPLSMALKQHFGSVDASVVAHGLCPRCRARYRIFLVS